MQACILRSAFRVVTEYRSVPGAKRMVYPQVRQSGCLKRPALRRMPQLEAREFIHVYFTFRNIPPDFKKGEKVYVVQYEFSGIQSFIFGEANMNTSIRDVHGRSLYIRKLTDELEREIRKYWKKTLTPAGKAHRWRSSRQMHGS